LNEISRATLIDFRRVADIRVIVFETLEDLLLKRRILFLLLFIVIIISDAGYISSWADINSGRGARGGGRGRQ